MTSSEKGTESVKGEEKRKFLTQCAKNRGKMQEIVQQEYKHCFYDDRAAGCDRPLSRYTNHINTTNTFS